MTEYAYELWQDGMMVAGVSGYDIAVVRSEILHYAAMYAQDGPVSIRGADLAALMPAPPPEKEKG